MTDKELVLRGCRMSVLKMIESGSDSYMYVPTKETKKWDDVVEILNKLIEECEKNTQMEINVLVREDVSEFEPYTMVLGVYDNDHIQDAEEQAVRKYGRNNIWTDTFDLNEM